MKWELDWKNRVEEKFTESKIEYDKVINKHPFTFPALFVQFLSGLGLSVSPTLICCRSQSLDLNSSESDPGLHRVVFWSKLDKNFTLASSDYYGVELGNV